MVGVVALPDGTLCSSDTLCHQLLVTVAVTTATVHDAEADTVAAAHTAGTGRGAASSAAVLPRRLGRQVNAEVLAEGAVRLVRGEQPPIPGQLGASAGSTGAAMARGA